MGIRPNQDPLNSSAFAPIFWAPKEAELVYTLAQSTNRFSSGDFTTSHLLAPLTMIATVVIGIFSTPVLILRSGSHFVAALVNVSKNEFILSGRDFIAAMKVVGLVIMGPFCAVFGVVTPKSISLIVSPSSTKGEAPSQNPSTNSKKRVQELEEQLAREKEAKETAQTTLTTERARVEALGTLLENERGQKGEEIAAALASLQAQLREKVEGYETLSRQLEQANRLYEEKNLELAALREESGDTSLRDRLQSLRTLEQEKLRLENRIKEIEGDAQTQLLSLKEVLLGLEAASQASKTELESLRKEHAAQDAKIEELSQRDTTNLTHIVQMERQLSNALTSALAMKSDILKLTNGGDDKTQSLQLFALELQKLINILMGIEKKDLEQEDPKTPRDRIKPLVAASDSPFSASSLHSVMVTSPAGKVRDETTGSLSPYGGRVVDQAAIDRAVMYRREHPSNVSIEELQAIHQRTVERRKEDARAARKRAASSIDTHAERMRRTRSASISSGDREKV